MPSYHWLILSFQKFQVICSVLQVLNQIIKDNTEVQENACLVGLVSVLKSKYFSVFARGLTLDMLNKGTDSKLMR